MKFKYRFLGVFSLIINLSACSKKTGDANAGKVFFETVVGKGYACSDCHSITKNDTSGRIQPGHNLTGVLSRKDFWGVELRGRNESAVNASAYCYARFQTMDLERLEKKYADSLDGLNPAEVLAEADKDNLQAFFESISDAQSGFSSQPPIEDKLLFEAYLKKTETLKPDTSRGREIYSRACAWCHGDQGEGIRGKGKSLKINASKKALIVEQIRLGGYRMPFFTEDKLSDNDLVSLINYAISMRNP